MFGRDELCARALRGELQRVESEAAHLRAMLQELEKVGGSIWQGDISSQKRMRLDTPSGLLGSESFHRVVPQPVKPTNMPINYSQSNLSIPLSVVPNSQSKLNKPSPTCDKCAKTFTTQKDLRRHNATRHEGIRYPCEHCGRSFARPYQLRHHVEEKHAGKENIAPGAGSEHIASTDEREVV